MAKSVVQYQLEIQYAQQKIQEIQVSCSHLMYELCMYSWRVGSSYPTRLCVECRAPIPGITPEEYEKTKKNSFNHYYTVTTKDDKNG